MPVQRLRTFGRTVWSALLCLALVVWSVAPATDHAPSVFDVIADHRAMIAEHGHTHGFHEDLAWALHGHSHDVADHDHSPAVLALAATTNEAWDSRDAWHLHESSAGPYRSYMIDRPPRG